MEPLLGMTPPPDSAESPELRLRRRYFLAVIGVTACSSGTSPACTPTPGEDASVDDVPEDLAPPEDAKPDDATPTDDAPVSDASTCTAAGVRVASVSDITVGSFRLIQQRPSILIILGRDDQGIYAYSARCTHTGCTIPAPTGTTALSSCPCHFSRFDAQGRVQAGSMARLNLDHYAVTLCDGGVYVDRTAVVPITTRAITGA